MITNKLSKRLKEIVKLVDGKRVVDVGCDHGKVVNYLLCNNFIDYAVCTDISLPSVKKAEELLDSNHITKDKFDIRCGDGLTTITGDDNLDTIIIAGMGGKEIIHILDTARCLCNTLILQPQRNEIEVKKYILQHKFDIVYDKIVEEDGKFYTIIKAVYAEKDNVINEFDLLFGQDNFSDNEDFLKYLDYQYQKYDNLLSKVSNSDRQKVSNMLHLIKQAKDLIRRI